MTQNRDAVVYDLDGTLVRLVVDWEAVEDEIGEILRAADVDPDALSAWELLDAAEDVGVGCEVDALIAAHERAGAERSVRLPRADELAGCDRPVGVCSLNCEDAVRIALARHDLAGYVSAVVGRDTVGARKPDPAPLLAAVRELDTAPDRVLFVGDSERDAETARRAGTAFEYAGDR